MSTVLKHATIYTGEDVITDGYLRFDKQIEAVGPMSEYRAQPKDDVSFVNGKVIDPTIDKGKITGNEDKGYQVTGQSVPNTPIVIKDKNGTPIAWGETDGSGTFVIPVDATKVDPGDRSSASFFSACPR